MRSPPADFICIACECNVDRRWWQPRDRTRSLPPICSYCEHHYTTGIGKPTHGSFMDRRNAMRIAALAECLRGTAAAKEWGSRYGHA